MNENDDLNKIAPESEIMALLHAEARKNGTGAMSMQEIDKEIAEYRKEKALKNAQEPD